jgi:hypothetical protein
MGGIRQWAVDGLENAPKMKQGEESLRGFIPFTVTCVADLFRLIFLFLPYFGGISNCLNKFNMPKTPYLHTLALTKFLLECIKQPIRWGG